MTENVLVSREVPWLTDPAALAHSLSRFDAWAWLDGEGDASAVLAAAAETMCSYFAVASAVRFASRGAELDFIASLEAEGAVSSDAPGFSGGWITAFSYEFGVSLLGITPAADDAAPAFALRVTEVLELNHRTNTATLYGTSEAALDAWWNTHSHAWATSQKSLLAPIQVGSQTPDNAQLEARAHTSPTQSHIAAADPNGADTHAPASPWRRTPQEYQQQVSACQAAITEGEAYVLCLTDQATAPTDQLPLALYLALRHSRISLRGAVIVTPERALVSASPERFLSLRDSELRTHPIKGTRPRGSAPENDAVLARELAADPKERAENLMIVDLMRNDLNRVCVPGSVATTDFLQVETHPYVHQLVSTVTGTVRAEASLGDVFTAVFPGGSMTGAPKHRAVEILADLEQSPRGLYSGCFGWIRPSDNGHAEIELAMTIRSIELRAETLGAGKSQSIARIGAGGGITADSVPESEHAERILKAQPLLAVIGH